MSDLALDVKSNSKPKINIKGKITKQNQKNKVSSLTPNKAQKPNNGLIYNNNNSKININNSTVIAPHNNNFNINNNISININIDMSNKKQKLNNTTKNKSQTKSKPISIKKVEFKNNNSLIFNTLKNYANKNNTTKSPFHIRIKSDNIGLKNYKFNGGGKNNSKLAKSSYTNTKKFFNLTTTGYNPKKEESVNNNKTTIEPKNISLENMTNNINNEVKKDNSISITADQLNDKKLFKNKSNQAKKPLKNIHKKRNNFSPSINRELLNHKQNIILNYSIGNKKININNKTLFNNDNKNKTAKPKYNFKDISTSPFAKNKNISLKKKNNFNTKENKAIASLLSKNQAMNKNKKDIMNYKIKSPFKNQRMEMKNSKLNNTSKNFRINNKYDFNMKSPNIENKNLGKMIKPNKNIKNKEINDKKETPQQLQKEVNKSANKESNKEIMGELKENENKIEEKKNKVEVEKNEEENKKIKEEKNEKDGEKKRVMNQSKSQNDINSDFIKKKLEEKKNNEKIENLNLKPSEHAIKNLLKIESICKKGFAGPGVKKTNQDNFFIYKNFLDSSDNLFLGVCDGHGMFGHDISGYIVNHLPQNLNDSFLKENLKSFSSKDDFTKVENILSLTFVQTNINLVNDDNLDSTFSGTTCSSLLFCPEKLISANIGDSRCVLGKFDGKNWKAKNLTRDHKPSEEDEKKRITEKGGRIEAYKDEDGEFVGPERVWLKGEDVPGLAMSRSFGDDIAHTVGVISQPEIFEYNFLNEDKFILLASDGIWEFISSDECVNIVKDYYLKDDIDGALSYLYKESSKRWIMEEEVIDDITLIIMFLN